MSELRAMVQVLGWSDVEKVELHYDHGDDEEFARFHWRDGTTVDVPMRAVAAAYRVLGRASGELGQDSFNMAEAMGLARPSAVS